MSGAWKDHPVIVAAVSASGAMVALLLLYQQVVIPTVTKQLENEIASLNGSVASLELENTTLREEIEEKSKFIEEVETDLEQVKKENESLLTRIAELELDNVFMAKNPYPIGLGKVRIGDPLEKVNETFNKIEYPNAKIRTLEDGAWIYLIDAHSLFRTIVYTIREEDEDTKIDQVGFFVGLGDGRNREIFSRKLKEAFPMTVIKENEIQVWETGEETYIYKIIKSWTLVMS